MTGRQQDSDGTVYDDGTIRWMGCRIRPISQDIWEEGPGQRYSFQFVGTHATAEGRGQLTGASRLRWGCEPGERSPPGYNPLQAERERIAKATTPR